MKSFLEDVKDQLPILDKADREEIMRMAEAIDKEEDSYEQGEEQ